jgi:CBS domain containing-hemolysin-like protein
VLSDGLRFTVLDVEGSRIQRLEVEFLPAPEHAGEEGEAA